MPSQKEIQYEREQYAKYKAWCKAHNCKTKPMGQWLGERYDKGLTRLSKVVGGYPKR